MKGVIPDTLKARALLLLTLVFVVSHMISIMIYKENRYASVVLTEATDFGQRIIGIVDLAYRFPANQRHDILSAAQTQFLTTYPDIVPIKAVACQQDGAAAEISRRIFQPFETRPSYQVDVCVRRFGGVWPLLGQEQKKRVDILVNIHFPDDETASFHAELPEANSLFSDRVIIYLVVVTTLALLLAWHLILKLIAPINRLAGAAEKIGVNLDVESLEEVGPRETRVALRAFNEMQVRLQRQLHGQTEMFAAISHDLKSAVTRLQLRCDLLHDEKEREGLQRVVKDMRFMIASIIDFVRGDSTEEPVRRISLGDLLASLCEDLIEESVPIEYHVDQTVHLYCRPMSLRRAIQNLIDNACKHAGSAYVEMQVQAAGVFINIDDQGPGVPESRLEDVLRPFVTVDASRTSTSSGMGLGLAIAHKIILSHGGTLRLTNKPGGGLRAQLYCPFGNPLRS